MAIDGMNFRDAASNALTYLEHLLGLDDMEGEAPVPYSLQQQNESQLASYTVNRGDTLSEIAQTNHTAVSDITQLNGITNSNKLKKEQKLELTQTIQTTDVPRQNPRPVQQNNGALVAGSDALKVADTARSGVLPKSQSKCYAYVKKALQRSGAVSDYIPGVAAKNAGTELKKRGFQNILDDPSYGIQSPYDAPPGAVLVYGAAPGATDKNAQYGHIEVRTRDGFASDYFSPHARTGDAENGLEGRGRVLIGVYIKPENYSRSQTPTAGTR
jgi:LysM repeat protein